MIQKIWLTLIFTVLHCHPLRSMSSFEESDNPLQNALNNDDPSACIRLLHNNCCTNISNGILDSPYHALRYAMDGNKTKCIEILISSKKMCPYTKNCSHSNNVYWLFSFFSKSYDSPTDDCINCHDATLKETLKDYCEYLDTPQRYTYFSYIQKRAIMLSIISSPTQTSFNEKWSCVSRHGKYLFKTFVTFAKWASDPKRDNSLSKNHIGHIFMCPAFVHEFEHLLAEEPLCEVIYKIDGYSIKNALIAQNSESLRAVFNKTLEHNQYHPDKKFDVLEKLRDGINNHLKIWPEYAQQIKHVTAALEKQYHDRQKNYTGILRKQNVKDAYFNFQ